MQTISVSQGNIICTKKRSTISRTLYPFEGLSQYSLADVLFLVSSDETSWLWISHLRRGLFPLIVHETHYMRLCHTGSLPLLIRLV